jgi:hypothetical protein
MGRQIGKVLPRPQATRIRRVLIAFLAALYLVVGFAGEISCAEESLIQSTPISTRAASVKTDEDSKKTPEVVEHCYTCVPITIPAAAAQVSEPVSVSVNLSFPSDAIILVEARLVDPPPPKTST